MYNTLYNVQYIIHYTIFLSFIEEALEYLEELLLRHRFSAQKCKLEQLKNHLKGYQTLRVFAFNGGKYLYIIHCTLHIVHYTLYITHYTLYNVVNIIYLAKYDVPCIFPYLVKSMEDKEFSIIKQGSSYRSIYVIDKIMEDEKETKVNKFAFLDVLHFTSPCNYSNYLKQWGVTEEKSIFPYQHYSSIEELEEATEFPPKTAFYSDLTDKTVSDEDYDNSKNEYDTRRQLPGKHIIYKTLYIIQCTMYNVYCIMYIV